MTTPAAIPGNLTVRVVDGEIRLLIGEVGMGEDECLGVAIDASLARAIGAALIESADDIDNAG
jgi:ABC-type uncharacterized transport system ATPase subunit